MRYKLLISLFLAGFYSPTHAEWHAASQAKMGTRIEIQLWHADPARAAELIAQGMSELDRIEAAMSTYRESSEISRVNREAARQPVVVSQELYDLVAWALQLSELSDGAFDISYDSVGQLYDFRARERPDSAAIKSGLDALDYRLVRLQPKNHAIAFAHEGVRINLGGIAKGHAVESVVRLLRDAGVSHALATAGGDTRLLGDRRGKPWVVGIRDPDLETDLVTRLALSDEAISTSGDYERFFDEDGRRYHHIISPSTGDSARDSRSVTVIGPDATLTDGLSTSLFVLGPEAGLALIETLNGYEAVIVDAARQLHFSSGLDPS